ncbi:MAG TPA: zinc dependent phospholipase C family protein [Dehalococcoidia bacterium]|nr:zinc dependent phospholipase C family protein [Dehalococcoidia bacterium]
MPPLSLHTSLARRIAERLRLDVLNEERGNLYLGATAPDIRVITRWERERTHFFDLDNFDAQDAVGEFFRTHPSLSDPKQVTPAACAFVAGYVSHLVLDATWIDHIYRPYFGRNSDLGGGLRANVLDRALQFSLDADTRDNAELMADVVREVACCDLEIDLGFIDRETLGEWHRVISDFAQTRPDWDRFKSRIVRHLGDSGAEVTEDFDELTRDLPELVDETLRFLSRERIEEWMNESLDASVGAVREYMQCA